MRYFRAVEDGVHHHLIGRNRDVQHVLELHLDMLVIEGAARLGIEQFLSLHVVGRDVGNVDMDGHLLASALQVRNREAGVDALAHIGPRTGHGGGVVARFLLAQCGRSVGHEELRIAVRTGDVLAAVVTLAAGTGTVVGAVGLHEDLQIAVAIFERGNQVELVPAGLVEIDAVIDHQRGTENLIVPVHRGGGEHILIRALHIYLHGDTGAGGCADRGLHLKRERGERTVCADFLLQIEHTALRIAVGESERVGAVAGTGTHGHHIQCAGVGRHVIGGVKVDQRGCVGGVVGQQFPRLVTGVLVPTEHTLGNGRRKLGGKRGGGMIVHDDSIRSSRHHGLALGHHRETQRIVVSQTILREFGGPHADVVVVVHVNLVVGEVVDAVEGEHRGLVAVESVGEGLRNGGAAVHRVVHLDGRHNVGGAVVGDANLQVLVAEVTVGDRVHEFEDGHIVHERGIDHRTDHEAAGELRLVHAVVQIEEGGVAERGLDL